MVEISIKMNMEIDGLLGGKRQDCFRVGGMGPGQESGVGQ